MLVRMGGLEIPMTMVVSPKSHLDDCSPHLQSYTAIPSGKRMAAFADLTFIIYI